MHPRQKYMNLFSVLIAAWILAACGTTSYRPVEIKDAWARPALTGQTSAIYLTIDNPNRAADALHGASTDVAGAAELHQSVQDSQGVMSMHPQHGVDVPGEDQVIFAPGGLHIMLVNLNQDLKPGDTIELRLDFEKTGEIVIQVPVKEEP